MLKTTFPTLCSCFTLLILLAPATGQSLRPGEGESEWLQLIRSDAPAAEKALACKQLAIYGSEAAVADLANLLPNPELSSWARIPLEAIPGPAPSEALRLAMTSLEGRLLVGVINSIGVRRDAEAVEMLVTKLTDADEEVASAAAAALGSIGNPAATNALRGALADASTKELPAEVVSSIAAGCVLCAERLHHEGSSAAAVEIYDEVRHADVPKQRIVEATRGAILARKQEGIPLLLETLRSTDKQMFQLALGTVREISGGEVDEALAAELTSTAPARGALLVQAMADRPDTVPLAALLNAAEAGDKLVRLSAIDALQRVGDDSCLAALLRIASGGDADLATAAQRTVAVLPGERVNAEIRSRLARAKDGERLALLRFVGQRRIAAVEDVLKSLDSTDPKVRSAALTALGETVPLSQLSLLVRQAVLPKYAEDAKVATQALKAASVRMPDPDACAAQLTAAMRRAPAAAKTTLLEIMAEVGGEQALDTLATAAKSADAQLQDAGSRLLGKWNSVAAAPVLLDLAKNGPAEKYRVRALRGYLGLARKFSMPDAVRAEMCQNAFDVTKRASEHKLALSVLQLHPSVEGLKIAMNAMKVPALKEDATTAALAIAQKIGGSAEDVSKLMSGAGLDSVKLEILKAEYGAGKQQKDVTALLQQQSRGLPLVMLRSPQYNSSFGGDPAPGVQKQLKVRYRIDGRLGEASFKENALILLPMPK